jgi:5-amino-6-(5-phospho-D-ribitylamino)uracil phosphatase
MLFAAGLDGTIVTGNNELPARIRDAILGLRRHGHQVTVITGRHHSGAQLALETLSSTGHYGTCNGARVHADGENHHLDLHLETHVVSALLGQFTESPGHQFFLSTRDRMSVRDPEDARWKRERQEGRQLQTASTYQGEAAHKLILMGEDAGQLVQELKRRFPANTYDLWANDYLEVMAQGADKGQALQQIAEHYGVPQSEIVAFGDGPNDVEMLRCAGHAVGVGTLAPGVAGVIDEHVAGPEELGVAHWLAHFQLRSEEA